MPKILIKEQEYKIQVPILLTAVSGKIRIKNRSVLNEYGLTISARQENFKRSNYVEWQIGYDVKWGKKYKRDDRSVKVKKKKDLNKLAETTLENIQFLRPDRTIKSFYELSEYVWYFYEWGIVSKRDLKSIVNYLNSIPDNNLIDNNSELQIDRSHPIVKNINGFGFEYTQVKYPLLIYKFNGYEIVTEIKITEKQYAVGTQPMLYLCFPITELKSNTNLIGRCAEVKEIAHFEISESNIKVFLEMLKMFGILSKNHKHDILQIINTIIE
jgi:hypothetical protein